VTDRQPPKLAGDERATLQALLQFQRDSFVRKVSGVSEDGARQRFVGSATTLLWLTKHMARAELIWFVHRFAGEDMSAVADDTVQPDDTLADAIALYRATCTRTDAIVAATESLDALCSRADEVGDVNLRWVLAHLLEETARHAGHADILRELIDGDTGR
jgi:uncharacterized damage-inducible protein DinB